MFNRTVRRTLVSSLALAALGTAVAADLTI